MPFLLDNSSNPIRFTCQGELNASDTRQILYRSPQGPRIPNRLVDLRTTEDFSFSAAEFMLISAEASLESYPNSYRCALLVDGALSRGIARMWQNLNEPLDLLIEIFEDENKALEWLGA